MQKKIMVGLFFVAVLLGVAGLFQKVSIHAEENKPDPNADQKIVFEVSNFQFDHPEYEAKVGETKTLVMKIKDGLHEVGVEGMDVHLTKAENNQQVTFDKPGEYIVRCVLPCGDGHEQMVAKLIVTEA